MVGKGDPKIAELGKKTRFKKGHKLSVGNKSMTYRQQLAWVRDQEIDPNDIDGSIKKLLGIMPVKGKGNKLTISRAFAIRYIEKALKKCDPNLFDKIINQSEGNLTQEIIIPSTSPAPTDFISDEEAERVYREHINK